MRKYKHTIFQASVEVIDSDKDLQQILKPLRNLSSHASRSVPLDYSLRQKGTIPLQYCGLADITLTSDQTQYHLGSFLAKSV